MNVSELKDKKEAIIALLNDVPVWSLDSNGEWFKIDTDTDLTSELEPLVVQDKFFEERKAFAEGKPIQWKVKESKSWNSMSTTPIWLNNIDYRVKPAEKEWFWLYKTTNNKWSITAYMYSESEIKTHKFNSPTKVEALGFKYKE